MPDPDEDNPATMTGPSYRMTSPAHRMTDPVNRGLASPRVAQAGPGSGKTHGARDLIHEASHGDAASRKKPAGTKAAQQLADDMMTELLPHFAKLFGRWKPARPVSGSFVVGKRVPVVVLTQANFAAEVDAWRQQLLDEERDLLTTWRPKLVAAQLGGQGRGSSVTPAKVTPSTTLSKAMKEALWPQTGDSTRVPGAFYSA